MLTRALLLFGLIAAVSVAAVVTTIQLPEIPLLRYTVLAAPLVGALVVVVEWYEACSATPSTLAADVPARTPSTARNGRGGPSPTA